MTTRKEFVQVSRDAFARGDIIRRIVTRTSCKWCGNPAKYQYGWWDDGGRKSWQEEVFCSISCMRCYTH